MNNTAVQGWSNRGSFRLPMAVGTILKDLVLMTRNYHIYSYVQKIKGTDNTTPDAASRLTHLSDRMFLKHLAINFLQKNPWRMLTLPSGCRRRLDFMMHRKRCRMYSQPPFTRKTLMPGANGANSAYIWESQTTSKVSGIPSLSSIYLPSVCLPAF